MLYRLSLHPLKPYTYLSTVVYVVINQKMQVKIFVSLNMKLIHFEIYFSIQYIHPSRKDTKQIGEMVFGTAPIANQFDCFKVI